MQLNADGTKPIYVQISEYLETEILSGSIHGDEKIYSQYQLAEMFNINPATAAKGLNILADEGVLYKKRGLGMFVSPHAKEKITERRKDQVVKFLMSELVMEADRLGIKEEDLMRMMKDVKAEMTRRELL